MGFGYSRGGYTPAKSEDLLFIGCKSQLAAPSDCRLRLKVVEALRTGGAPCLLISDLNRLGIGTRRGGEGVPVPCPCDRPL